MRVSCVYMSCQISINIFSIRITIEKMSKPNKCNRHNLEPTCNCVAPSPASQSLDEVDFERGIWCAAQYGDLQRVKILIKQVNDRDAAGYTALHYAARNGHVEVCEVLIRNGAEIDAVTRSGKASALHRACSTGRKNVINYLLNNSANILLQDTDGKTALHRAFENNHIEICKILLEKEPKLKHVADNKGVNFSNVTL